MTSHAGCSRWLGLVQPVLSVGTVVSRGWPAVVGANDCEIVGFFLALQSKLGHKLNYDTGGFGVSRLGKAVAHEFDHTCLSMMAFPQWDEYSCANSLSFCGHSMMSQETALDSTGSIANQFCTVLDHCMDPRQANPLCATLQNAWDYADNSSYMNYTPAFARTPYSTHFTRNDTLRDKITVTYP